MPRSGWQQGYYKPRNPDKYIGNPNNIRYLSSWEYELNKVLDNNPNILRWSSEGISIPYVKPTNPNKTSKYYPDYYIEYKNKHGEIIKEIIEVKPQSQIDPPKRTGKNKKQQLHEQITHAINTAKWRYAKTWCDKYNIKFRIVSEKDLFK